MSEERDTSGVMSNDAIAGALEAAKKQLNAAERERSVLDGMIASGQEEVRLLERLLAIRQGGQIGATGVTTESGGNLMSRPEKVVQVKHRTTEAVLQELLASGRPLHISELMRLLRGKNVPIPGSGTQANLINYLRRDERFVRPSRGMYGLSAWGIQNMSAPARRRRRRKRTSATSGK